MSFLRSRFVQAVLVLVIAFVVLRFGIQPPAPWSVLTLYMSIVLLAVLVFVSSDSDSWREFVRPIRATLVSPDRRHTRLGLLIVLPLLLGYYAYTQAAAKPQAPPALRAVHPAPPASLQDAGAIAMLQEAYLFWRIAKGGPGLPKESTPWNSVMPAWEDRLTEEQIWQVIIYLYDATGQRPRRWEESH